MTCCPTRTSAPSSTAAKSTPTATRRCRSASAAAAAAAGARRRRRARLAQDFEVGGATAPISATFSKACSAARGRRAAAASAAFGRRPRRRARAPTSAYRLRVPFADAATLKPQRITLADGKTIDLKLPAGVETAPRCGWPARASRARAATATRSSRSRSQPHRFFKRDGDDVRLDLPITLDEAVRAARSRCRRSTAPVMLTVPKGSSSGKVLRLKGKGFTARAASAATSWSRSRSIFRGRCRTRRIRRREWDDAATRARNLGSKLR